MRSASALQSRAEQAYDDAQSLSNQLANRSRKAVSYVKSQYPSYRDSIRETLSSGLDSARGAFLTARDEVMSGAACMTRNFRVTERTVLKLGAAYLLVKWFASPEKESTRLAEKAKAQVVGRPVESALIAFGIGYLVGKVIR